MDTNDAKYKGMVFVFFFCNSILFSFHLHSRIQSNTNNDLTWKYTLVLMLNNSRNLFILTQLLKVYHKGSVEVKTREKNYLKDNKYDYKLQS